MPARSPARPSTAESLAFTVPGKAVGYYTQGARPDWKRMNAYHAYSQYVRWAAKAAGIRLPLGATETVPVIITTRLHCKTRIHHDPENVHKAIVDSLFYGAKGGDKHVGGRFEPANYDGQDLVEVWIDFRPPRPSWRLERSMPSLSARTEARGGPLVIRRSE